MIASELVACVTVNGKRLYDAGLRIDWREVEWRCISTQGQLIPSDTRDEDDWTELK